MFDQDEGYPRCDYCGVLLKENDSVWMIGMYVLNKAGILVGHGIEDRDSSNEDADFCSLRCLRKKFRRIKDGA